MQIIALGLHKHNVSEKIWRQREKNSNQFYQFLQSLNEAEPNSEFLFVNSSDACEILAVVNDVEAILHNLKPFFLNLLHIKTEKKLIFHDLAGPDAVKHFLQLSLGIEGGNDSRPQEFLQKASESVKIANDLKFAGPVINRIYQSALMLRGKTKGSEVAVNHDFFGKQINKLVTKIFGDDKHLSLLAFGRNDSFYPIIKKALPDCLSKLQIYTAEVPKNSVYENYIEILDIDRALLESQVVFRMNQEAAYFFEAENLNKLMQKRKNQPILIVSLDSTIISESALNRIYNLYNYDLLDFQSVSTVPEGGIDVQVLIENELKEVFTWFYAQQYQRFGNIVSKSRAMERILEMIARISQSDISVLIQGDSGTGKEIIARAIHKNSPRRDKPFVVFNCGALTETLLESELFGHEKGAFTGAEYTKKGLFEEADSGTIFLDEIGDTSPALQVKLLRVLQEGEIKRVGSTATINIDVRVVTASNQNLEKLVKGNKFRQDLIYRLNVVKIDIPPLVDRKEDILPLSEFFMGKYSDKMKKRVTGFTDRVRQALLLYPWPGNVRELENTIERAVALAIGNIIHTNDLPDIVREKQAPGAVGDQIKNQLTLKEIEKEVISSSLIAHDWNYDKVAEILDIGRTTLWRKMKEYGISKQ